MTATAEIGDVMSVNDNLFRAHYNVLVGTQTKKLARDSACERHDPRNDTNLILRHSAVVPTRDPSQFGLCAKGPI
jgi:hypothetical protein